MKNKLPVILAIAVASQCAPFVTEVKGENESGGQTEVNEDILLLSENQSIIDQSDDSYLEQLLSSEKMYLNQDAALLCNMDVPAASTAALTMRTPVFVLESNEAYSLVSDAAGNLGWISRDYLSENLADIFDVVDRTMYVNADNIPVYASPETDSVLSVLNTNDQVHETGVSTENYARIEVNGQTGYILNTALQDHALTFSDRLSSIQSQRVLYTWTGAVLSPSNGSVIGPSGKETYYNLDMSTVISVMRSMGFNAADYPYWIRSDGAKMLGPYIMAAANLGIHPKGTTMQISMGTALVCDTGAFASNGSGTAVDVAVSW